MHIRINIWKILEKNDLNTSDPDGTRSDGHMLGENEKSAEISDEKKREAGKYGCI